jgi:CBS domain-containing protein
LDEPLHLVAHECFQALPHRAGRRWQGQALLLHSRDITAVEPDESVVAALDPMIETRRRGLPVVERRPAGPIVVGMVRRSDVLRCLVVGVQEAPPGRP